MRRVDAVDIEGRIGFGIALVLCGLEHLAEIGACALHFGEDVIAGPVENAVNALDPIGRRAFAQSLDHGDTARNCRLELERGAAQGRLFGQRQAVVRDHRLVRGDETLARIERRACQRQRRAVRPADEFEHDIDIGPLRHSLHIVDPGIGCEIDPAIARTVAGIHRDDLDRAASAAFDQRAVGFE